MRAYPNHCCVDFAGGTLGDCLSSVRGQSVPVEHVVVDGASSDGTLDVLRAAPGISRLVSEPDGGIYEAMNKGIGMATGEIVGTLNADDVYAAPDVLAAVARAFEEPSVEACYGNLPQGLGSFDVMVSLVVIEHLHAPRLFMKTPHGLLRQGGTVIISTPYDGYWKNLAIAVAGRFDAYFSPLWDGGHIKFW
ncbi:glycosyltransferase [Acidobacteria bacterium ACD]|nr:MAG: glycosyltransferase [Acidobacteriota bacterium]MCE7929431.1 glycosyltransferase [Chloroflexi bacterium CFX7]MDL1948653.1 glycosyltransferase [Acidobacteria bacterium ACD]